MKVLFIIAAATLVAVAIGTQNEDCHDGLESCLHRFFYHRFDEDRLDRCGQRLITRYGESQCSTCGAEAIEALKSKSADFSIASRPNHTKENCLVDCYSANILDTCDVEGYVTCGQTCITATPDNANCQADLVSCFNDHFGQDKPLENCAKKTVRKYGGAVNCVSCAFDPARYVDTSEQQTQSADFQTCASDCFATILTDCDEATYETCVTNCFYAESTSSSSSVAAAPVASNGYGYVVPLIACAALFAGLFVVKKRMSRVNEEELYAELRNL